MQLLPSIRRDQERGCLQEISGAALQVHWYCRKTIDVDGGKCVVAGEKFSIVGMHFEPWIKQYDYAGLALDEYPKIREWLTSVQAVPELARAYEKVKTEEEA